jgi:hypothetical protein
MGLTLARGRSVEAEKMGRGDDENSFGMLSSLETIHVSEKPRQEEKCATCSSSRQGTRWTNRTSKCSSLVGFNIITVTYPDLALFGDRCHACPRGRSEPCREPALTTSN